MVNAARAVFCSCCFLCLPLLIHPLRATCVAAFGRERAKQRRGWQHLQPPVAKIGVQVDPQQAASSSSAEEEVAAAEKEEEAEVISMIAAVNVSSSPP